MCLCHYTKIVGSRRQGAVDSQPLGEPGVVGASQNSSHRDRDRRKDHTATHLKQRTQRRRSSRTECTDLSGKANITITLPWLLSLESSPSHHNDTIISCSRHQSSKNNSQALQKQHIEKPRVPLPRPQPTSLSQVGILRPPRPMGSLGSLSLCLCTLAGRLSSLWPPAQIRPLFSTPQRRPPPTRCLTSSVCPEPPVPDFTPGAFFPQSKPVELPQLLKTKQLPEYHPNNMQPLSERASNLSCSLESPGSF